MDKLTMTGTEKIHWVGLLVAGHINSLSWGAGVAFSLWFLLPVPAIIHCHASQASEAISQGKGNPFHQMIKRLTSWRANISLRPCKERQSKFERMTQAFFLIVPLICLLLCVEYFKYMILGWKEPTDPGLKNTHCFVLKDWSYSYDL